MTTNFELLLDELYDELENLKKIEKIKLPKPEIIRKNNKYLWKNVNNFLKIVNRHPDHFIKFIENNFIHKVVWMSNNRDDGLFFIQRTDTNYVINIMNNYIKLCVQCSQCNCINTNFEKDNDIKKFKLCCNNCKAEKYL
jgi:translation initiation factor 2 beta subunit (eIF-2beta)/eIF-5